MVRGQVLRKEEADHLQDLQLHAEKEDEGIS